MSDPGGAARTPSYRRVVDLSHLVDPHIPPWPGDPPIVSATVTEPARGGYHLRRFSTGECNTTHVSAPGSFHAADEDETGEANRRVLAHAGIVLENAANLDHLLATGRTPVIGILRLRHGAGSPAAVTAIVPRG